MLEETFVTLFSPRPVKCVQRTQLRTWLIHQSILLWTGGDLPDVWFDSTFRTTQSFFIFVFDKNVKLHSLESEEGRKEPALSLRRRFNLYQVLLWD